MNGKLEINTWTRQCVLLGGSGVTGVPVPKLECALLRPFPVCATTNTAAAPHSDRRHLRILMALMAFLHAHPLPVRWPGWIAHGSCRHLNHSS